MTNLKFIDSTQIKTIKRDFYMLNGYNETHCIIINGYYIELDTEKKRDKLFFKLLSEMDLSDRFKKEKDLDKKGNLQSRDLKKREAINQKRLKAEKAEEKEWDVTSVPSIHSIKADLSGWEIPKKFLMKMLKKLKKGTLFSE